MYIGCRSDGIFVFTIIGIGAALALAAGCAGGRASAAAGAPAQQVKTQIEMRAEGSSPYKPQLYLINVGDVIEISVWRAKDLDRDVIVRPDGLISYPLVGDIPAAGLTLTELDRQVTERLNEFVRHPEVSVAIKRFGGTKVIILGEVKSAGVYTPSGLGSVLEVVALAGGFTDDAVRSRTILIRGGLANPKPVRLNLAKAIYTGDQSQNPPLMPNDIVYVPRRATASFNYYLSQITPTLSNLLLGTTISRDFGALPP